MTKEELEKEADCYAEKHAFRVPYDGSNKFYDDVDFKASKEAYLAGAEPREKRIADLERKLEQTEKDLTDYQFNYPKIKDLEKENAELKAQLEKMKCCQNCKHSEEDNKSSTICDECFELCYWEMKE